MNNLFDSDNYPDSEPLELIAGSRWGWKRSDVTAAYPTDTYTVKYDFSQGGENEFTITAGKVDSAHVVEEASTATIDKIEGDYFWQLVIVRDADSEAVAAESGFCTIKPPLDASINGNSWVYEALTAVRAVLKNTASEKQAAYSIGGRSISLRTPAELFELERELLKRWNEEKADILRKAGKSAGGRVLVRMSA